MTSRVARLAERLAKGFSGRLPRIFLGCLVLLCTVAVFGSWALSSPPGSGPDDEYHLSSIWCSHGYRIQYCEKSESIYEAKIPLQLHRNGGPRTIFCYAGDSRISARCIRELDPTAVTKLESSKRFNTSRIAARFYDANGYLVSANTNASILRMRFLQIAVSLVLVGFVISSSGERKWAILLALFVGIVPVGLFTIPSTNPSSWAITGVFTAGACAMNFFKSTERRHRLIAAMGLITALLLTRNLRSDVNFMMILCISLGVATGVLGRETKASLKINRTKLMRYGFVLLLGLIFFHLKVHTLAPQAVIWKFLSGKFHSLVSESPLLFLGLLGGSIQLGSPDFAPPSAVLILMGVGLAVFIGAVLRYVSPAVKVIASVGTSLIFALAYFYIDGAIGAVSRYLMAIYLLVLVMLASSAALGIRSTTLKISKSSRVTIFIAISLAQSLSLHQSIRRYVTGTNFSGWNLNKGAEWWWTNGPSPLSVWAIGSISFAVAIFIILQMTNRATK